MMRHTTILQCAWIVMCVGCGSEPATWSSIPSRTKWGDLGQFSGKVPEYRHQVPEPSPLGTGRTIAGDSEWGFPAILRAVDTLLLVGDPRYSPHFAVVDVVKDTVTRRFGRDGEGPREFRSPTWMLVESVEEKQVWIFDSAIRRFTLIDLDAADADLFVAHVGFNPNENVRQPVFTDSGFISNGAFVDFTFLVTDRAANERYRINAAPPFDSEELPDIAGLRMININRTALRPSSNELALLYVHSARIDFFTPAGVHRGTVLGPRDISTRYSVSTTGFRWLPDDEMAFLSAYGTDRYVYGFFCGCTTTELREAVGPSIIQIFRWNGDFVGEVSVDRSVLALAVSSDDSLLYAGVSDPEPALVEWNLPAWLRQAN